MLPDRAPDLALPDPEPTLRLVPDAALEDGSTERIRRSSYLRTSCVDAPPASRRVQAAFLVLWSLLAALTAHQLWGFGGTSGMATLVFDHGINNGLFVGASALTALRAWRMPSERAAWACLAVALLVYGAGDAVWSVFFSQSDATVTWADAFYLGFIPLTMAGIVLLVRARISRFDLDRWIDGIAAALLVSAPGVVLILGPTLEESPGDLLTKAVSVAYPIGDIVVLGAVVGAAALAGWHPGRAWLTLGLGIACFVAADSIYAVENLSGTYALGSYDFLWPLAGLLIATAAWLRPVRHEEVHVWGWRAIALPGLCQLAPLSLLYMQNEPVGEQLLMTAVLIIVAVQLVVTRPRRPEHLPSARQ